MSVKVYRKRLRSILQRLKGFKRKKSRRVNRVPNRLTYPEYMQSSLWEERKNRYYRDYGRLCRACGTFQNIHLHHMKYTAFDGTEPDGNLIPLCERHHDEFHRLNGSSKDMIAKTYQFIAEAQRR